MPIPTTTSIPKKARSIRRRRSDSTERIPRQAFILPGDSRNVAYYLKGETMNERTYKGFKIIEAHDYLKYTVYGPDGFYDDWHPEPDAAGGTIGMMVNTLAEAREFINDEIAQEWDATIDYDEDELLQRATKAFCKGGDVPQPSNASEVFEDDDCKVYVWLLNAHGILAIYRWYQNTDRLRRLTPAQESALVEKHSL
jgi:hypothetical protein